MIPEEAVKQHIAVKGDKLVPLHWATFDMALHPWYEPVERLVVEAEKSGISLLILKIGQQIDFKSPLETNFWWRDFMKTTHPPL